MRRLFWILLFTALLPRTLTATVDNERWTVEPFTDALGGGPATGPVEQAGEGAFLLCENGRDQLFLINGQFVDIVVEGQRYHLAGTGHPGMRDGPAPLAEFRFGFAGHLGAHDIACAPDGTLFVFDDGNARVRRIRQTNGHWQVDTWVGGGQMRLAPGQAAPPGQVRLPNTTGIAVAGDGSLWLGSFTGYYRVDPEGRQIRFVARWPIELRKGRTLHVVMGRPATDGGVYFLSRSPDVVIRVDPDGQARHLAGRIIQGRKPMNIGDGEPLASYFDTPSSLAVDPNGEALYLSGGDEYDIRRVPADGHGSTATLAQNGRWQRARLHPNRSRGAALYDPGLQGRLKPDGPLGDLMSCHLPGYDRLGRLYSFLYPWRGTTQYLAGKGLLGGRLYRLRRLEADAP
ncbi:hypothetical protein QVG61_07865 [Thiohalobacter sp. IOR34]|uniref:hypothetical protein n=1 Tax=Thiohalobacter sp. IOR34 TaxID=3057176 RepID=UPI0025B2359C|nr:hypothetical protein [Thiohalobacter sp. IOR34]WJW74433.1 hypothetical protein QVG61_07865 [Thiohalobacter sp. IOR34]